MNKLLLEVVCPATGKHYDFWIAKKLRISEVIVKLCYEISHKENNPTLFGDTDTIILLSTKTGALDLRFTLSAAGVCSGDTVILV